MAEPEPFRVEVYPERECVRVLPVGEVDLATAPVLEDCLRELIDIGFERLKLDLSRVSFLDCAGLRVLVGAWSRAQQTQAQFDVLHARGQVARLFALIDQPPALGWTARASRIDALPELVPGPGVHDDAPSSNSPTHGPRRSYERLIGIGRSS